MRISTALLGAMMALTCPTSASAQNYYARQRLATMPTPTYVATYSATYSACAGTGTTGTQSAPIATCRLGTQTVPNAQCPEQTKTRDCTLPPWRCGALTANRSWPSTGQYTVIGQPGNVTNAQTMCDAYVAGNRTPGVCLYLPASGNAAYTTTTTTPITISDPNSYAAGCRLN
jgi:hypothetical protein